VIVIPAGVPHQNVGSSPDFGVVGAYSEGRSWDVLRGLKGERPQDCSFPESQKTIRFMTRMAH